MLAYADDVAFIHHIRPQLKASLKYLFDLHIKTGLKLALHKTKTMWVQKEPKFEVTEEEVNAYTWKHRCKECQRGFQLLKV